MTEPTTNPPVTPRTRLPDRHREWSTEDLQRRVRRRAQWDNWARRQQPERWNGVDRD